MEVKEKRLRGKRESANLGGKPKDKGGQEAFSRTSSILDDSTASLCGDCSRSGKDEIIDKIRSYIPNLCSSPAPGLTNCRRAAVRVNFNELVTASRRPPLRRRDLNITPLLIGKID